MKLSDLKPANQLVKKYGIKSIVYGMAGSGKTPLINTAPNVVMLATEPGLLSMRNSSIPVFEANTVPKIKEFFEWLFKSAETKNFDSVAVDSITNLAEIYLANCLKTIKHGMQAYGKMSEDVFELVNSLYYLENKHIILLAKEGVRDNGRTTIIDGGIVTTEDVKQKIPSFPGQDLNRRIPYLFDNVFHLGKATVVGQVGKINALRTKEIDTIFARERSGVLSELEPPDINYIINKSQQ